MGACSSKSDSRVNRVAQDPTTIPSPPVASTLAVDVGANPIEAAKLINQSIYQHQQAVSTPTVKASSIFSSSEETVSPNVSPPSTHQKRTVQTSFDATSSVRRSSVVRVVSPPGFGAAVDSVKKQKQLFDLSLEPPSTPNPTSGAAAAVTLSDVNSLKQGTIRGAETATAGTGSVSNRGRALLQYPSEREYSIHRENSVKAMHKRAGSVSRANESESDEELEVDNVTSNQGNNASVRLTNSAKNSPKPLHGRKLSLSVNSPLPMNERNSPSPHQLHRRIASYDSAGTIMMSPSGTDASSAHQFISPPTAQRTLGLMRFDPSEPLNWKKKEVSLAHQVLQRQLLAIEQMSQQLGQAEAQSEKEEEPANVVNEYAPPPYSLGTNSPLLSFRRLPSRSRKNSVSIIAVAPASPSNTTAGTAPTEIAATAKTQVVDTAMYSMGNTSIPIGNSITPTGDLSPAFVNDGGISVEQSPELPSETKVEKIWAHYAGGRDVKEMSKKGLYQLGSDVYDEYCDRYKDRMMAIKREKSEEQVKKGGKPAAPYTLDQAERDLQADLPYLLPACASRGGSEPGRKEYVKYICKFLYLELTKLANSGLTSVGKGGHHERSRSALMGKDGTGMGSLRMRANSLSKNGSDLSMNVDRLVEVNGLDTFSAASASSSSSSASSFVKIRKMEFVLGWGRAQEALFQSIERVKSPADNSTCKLM